MIKKCSACKRTYLRIDGKLKTCGGKECERKYHSPYQRRKKVKEKKAFEALSYSRIKGDWGGEKVKKNKLDMVLELHHKTEGLLANIDSNAFQNLSVDLLNLSIRSSNCRSR